jgi:hypothetical protein
MNSIKETQVNLLYSISLFNKSEGKVERISDIDITLPKLPSKTKILFSNKVKKNQKWERLQLPDSFFWEKSQNEYTEEEIDWLNEDADRRLNGVWFMNNGVATYLTGVHYFYLQWCKIDIGYPEYRDRDRRFFTYWQACVTDPKCYGMIMVKHRREGATFKGAAIVLEYVTRNRNANGGLLSKTGADAKEFFYKLVKMFRGLPQFYQPMIAGTDNPKTVLEFDKPGERITKKTRTVQMSDALESKIEYKNTAENSFDSYKLARFVCDEGGKWEEANVYKNWQVVKPTLASKVLGKAFFPSTVNEMTRKGGANFKVIWDGSDPNDRPANNQTIEGLYRYFTPAYDGLEYGNQIFIDEYGMSIIETPEKPIMGINGDWIEIGAKDFLQNIRNSLKDRTNALAEHKRQYPWTPEEAFRVEIGNCSFDAEKLYQQREWNDLYTGKLITPGNFVWTKGFGSNVDFVPSKTGRWKITWVPNKDKQNIISHNRMGKIMPGNIESIVAGADPYDHSQTTGGRGSKGASYVFRTYNPIIEGTYQFVCQYIYRPSTVFEFYEDILRQCIFYGCQILVENNKIGMINWFEEHGYKHFLMRRPESTHTQSSRRQTTLGIPTSGDVVRDGLISNLEKYVVDCCGYDLETGEGGTLFFNELVEDLLLFEANDWQKYDATVAAGLTLLATQKAVRKDEPIREDFQLVKTYNSSGKRSVRTS